MRIVLAALGLVIVLASGWVVIGLTSDREEREFAVHYSWIVKWALSLARESQSLPEGVVFATPRIEVAGHPNRWVVSGYMTWRNVDAQPVDQPYTAIIENVCKAYADPSCWRLDGFAIGEEAVDLAQAALDSGDAGVSETSDGRTESTPAANSEVEVAAPGPTPSLSEEAGTPYGDDAVPEAPPPPLARNTPLPERKPAPPSRLDDEDTWLALSEPDDVVGDLDLVAVLREPQAAPAPMVEAPEASGAVADSGGVKADFESEIAAPSEPLGEEEFGEQDSDLALAEDAQRLPAADADDAPQDLAPVTPLPGSAATDGADVEFALTEPGTEPSTPTEETATTATAVPPLVQVVPTPAAETEPPAVPAPEPEPVATAALPPVDDPLAPASSAAPSTGSPSAATPGSVSPGYDAALVALIQDRLTRAGYEPGAIDGRFGSRTQRALMEFQSDAALPITGQPSRDVLAALERRLAGQTVAPQPQLTALPASRSTQPETSGSQTAVVPPPAPSAPPPSSATVAPPAQTRTQPTTATARAPGQPLNLIQPATPGPPGEGQATTTAADESLVFLIQHRLRTAGYAPGRFDGRMNETTANAIRDYQADRGLTVTGRPTRSLLDRLEAEILQKRQTEQPAPTPLGSVSCMPSVGVNCATSPA